MARNIKVRRSLDLAALLALFLAVAHSGLAHAQPIVVPLPSTAPPPPVVPPPMAPEPAPPPAAEGGTMDLQSLLNLFVTSASLQEEPIYETPGPVTVITGDMIQAIGARNLKEILTTYVPGFSAVEDHNELIFS